jgi:NAD(P)-dependent dehydrogenase (short-subunit alcohol dehydrogenase family)
MRILVVGASGTIGGAVVAELAARHDIVRAGRRGADVQVDIEKPETITAMYARLGRVDAVVAAAGRVHFGPLAEMTDAKLRIGIDSKLLGQLNLVLLGLDHVADGGSFTLTSGILSEVPVLHCAGTSLANGAIEAFVRGAAPEMPRGLRLNVVSPTVLTESMPKYGPSFRGFEPAPAARVALAYSRSVEGVQTGQVFKVH